MPEWFAIFWLCWIIGAVALFACWRPRRLKVKPESAEELLGDEQYLAVVNTLKEVGAGISRLGREATADGFDEGWHALYLQIARQEADPTHPITKVNPYRDEAR